MRNVTIIGAGSFGTALATVLDTAGNNVQIWAREKKWLTVSITITETLHICPISDCQLPSKRTMT